MVEHDIPRSDDGSAIDDVAYLTRSAHRVSTLTALAERPRSRSELCERNGVSSSTMRRTLGGLEDRSWIRKEGYQYVTTRLGEAIASGMKELVELVETEQKLRDVWHWLPDEAIEFAIGADANTDVTIAERDAPYRPVNRFRSLLRETDQFRFVGVDVALLEPCRELFRRRILDGMQAEIINPPEATRYIIETYPELCFDILESGNLNALVHDDAPSYGIGFLDERITVNSYNPDVGGVKVLIESDTPEAFEWAESIYADYRSEARGIEPEQVLE